MRRSKFSIGKTKNYKLSEEAGLKILHDFCFKFDIDIDAAEDRDEVKRIEKLLNVLLEYVRLGYVEIHDDYSITQHLQNPSGEVVKLEYKKITGEQKLAMDGFGENERYAMIYACLGAASGLGDSAIKKMIGIDLKVAEALSLAFLL